MAGQPSLAARDAEGGAVSAFNNAEWSDETVAQLRLLWDEGVSTNEIGRRLGVSKNAVCGKAHRLNLTPRPSPINTTGERKWRPPSVPRYAKVTLPTLPTLTATAKPRLTIRQIASFGRTPPKPPELTMEQLRLTLPVPNVARATRCQFPIWPHGEKPPRDVAKWFCNAPSHGSYCTEHHGRCYVKRSDLRWAA